MNKIDALKNKLRGIVKNAPDLPPEIKQHAVYYTENDGRKVYLNAYIPLIGEKYGEATKILFYCTAQALSKRNKDYLREYATDLEKAIDRLRLEKLAH